MSHLKAVGKSFCFAIAMYSRIPMPVMDWKEEEQKYVFCFFPVIGLAQAVLLYGLFWLCRKMLITGCFFAAVGTALPILLTGGIHMDGFMDTVDALHSYQGREKRLAILKDPHSGAFAVVGASVYFLLYLAAMTLVQREEMLFLLGLGFALSRTLSALALLHFKKAKAEGTLYALSQSASRRAVTTVLLLWLAVLTIAALIGFLWKGFFCLLAGFAFFFYYRYKAGREFGGISGDLAGWFLCLYEILFLWCTVFSFFWRG